MQLEVGNSYKIDLTALVDNNEAEIEHVLSLAVSDGDAAVPFTDDNGDAMLLAKAPATGVTVTGKCIVNVDGLGVTLVATSKPFDVIEAAAEPAIDPATGQPPVDEAGQPITNPDGSQLLATRLEIEIDNS